MKRGWMMLASWLLLAGGAPGAQHEPIPRVRAELRALYRQALSDAGKQDELTRGLRQWHFELCASCHGGDGKTGLADVPPLAGKPAAYLLEELEKFTEGRRSHPTMILVGGAMSDAQKVGAAIYFSRLTGDE